jgi:hypothetical protein
MFYPKGKLYTKKNRGRDRPLCLDSIDLMAEREGFSILSDKTPVNTDYL